MSETILTGNEKDFILEMMKFISNLPTSYEPIFNEMDRKFGIDEEDFNTLKDNLKNRVSSE
jgi:hypothetical protein